MVGFGSIGKRHANNLLKFSNMKVIICTSKKHSTYFKKKFKIVNSLTKGIEERPDFAIITNVTNAHVDTAIKYQLEMKEQLAKLESEFLKNTTSTYYKINNQILNKYILTATPNPFLY